MVVSTFVLQPGRWIGVVDPWVVDQRIGPLLLVALSSGSINLCLKSRSFKWGDVIPLDLFCGGEWYKYYVESTMKFALVDGEHDASRNFYASVVQGNDIMTMQDIFFCIDTGFAVPYIAYTPGYWHSRRLHQEYWARKKQYQDATLRVRKDLRWQRRRALALLREQRRAARDRVCDAE